MFKPLSFEMSQRFKTSSGKELSSINQDHPIHIKKGLSGDSSLRGIPWVPSSILCKRLNIEVPKTDNNSTAPSKPSTFVKEILNEETMRSIIKNISSKTQIVDMESDEHIDEIILAYETRPVPSIFKILFQSPFASSSRINEISEISSGDINNNINNKVTRANRNILLNKNSTKQLATNFMNQKRTLSFD